MDIVVQRYNPWFADTSILKANAGGFGFTTPGAVFGSSSANNPLLNYDPLITRLSASTTATFPSTTP